MHFTGNSIYLAVTFLSSSTAVLAAVQPYGQCGGKSFDGDSTCTDGWSCQKLNDYYSQCLGGNPNAPPGGPAPGPAPTAPGSNPSGAPVPSSNGTLPIAEPTPTPETPGNGTVPVVDPTPAPEPVPEAPGDGTAPIENLPSNLPSKFETIIVTPTSVVQPVAVNSTSVVAVPSTKPTAAPGTGANGAGCSLDALFKAHGKKYIGVATDKNLLSSGQNAKIIIDNFGQVTPENSMKWDATEATQGSFTLAGADALVEWATTNKKLIRGHTTVWHSQLPTWVSSIKDKTKLQEVMVAHIKKLMGAYAGKVYAWDVINEMFEENGSFRSSVFYNVLGEDFVKTAFTAARAADPNAKLYINDYNLDSPSYAKTKGFAAAVKKWVAAGVPIDGVGSQSHLAGNWPIADFPAALKLVCADVKECAMTELDIKGATSADYQTAVKACLDTTNCVGVTVWGVSDANSWRASEKPLLFDASFKAKEAYNGLCTALA
ncbi:glycosyl hydrolase family 10-domain-containing protein [Phaeosphaeriaceae sp. PMI808]|nr:glycosyl hydrolase family 10-domain-containing protein [Phaeosphaeriaceae sp. PMI808]